MAVAPNARMLQRKCGVGCKDRFGAVASYWLPATYFRSTPMSRHSQCPTACRERAKGPDVINHSITSFASAISVCGTASPSARAVFMLMTKSNFVGNCTGKSTVDVPRNILSM
jgi:hypothetical protein